MTETSTSRLIRGGTVVNVHTRELQVADVAVLGDRIATVGDVSEMLGDGTEVIDAQGRWLAPGLIEAVRAQVARESEVLAQIRAGRYDGRYAREAKG